MGFLIAPAEAPPASNSRRITAIAFGATNDIADGSGTQAASSDNWPLTWAEDGHQYTSWGDGGGWGGSATNGRVSLGFSRLEGEYATFEGFNVWGGLNPENAATFEGKVEYLVCIGGNLYGLRSDLSGANAWTWKEWIKSTTKGASWTIPAGGRLTGGTGGPGQPFGIQYGQNYTANTDGYMYVFSIQIEDAAVWEVQQPGVTWLARAPIAAEAFLVTANWEWLTGTDVNDDPTWGTYANRITVPGLSDADGYMRGSCIYISQIERYLMFQNHTDTLVGGLVAYEAPQPWGPWTQVVKNTGFFASDATKFRFGNMSPKWLSYNAGTGQVDGVFVYFRPDAWNSRTITLTTVAT